MGGQLVYFLRLPWSRPEPVVPARSYEASEERQQGLPESRQASSGRRLERKEPPCRSCHQPPQAASSSQEPQGATGSRRVLNFPPHRWATLGTGRGGKFGAMMVRPGAAGSSRKPPGGRRELAGAASSREAAVGRSTEAAGRRQELPPATTSRQHLPGAARGHWEPPCPSFYPLPCGGARIDFLPPINPRILPHVPGFPAVAG